MSPGEASLIGCAPAGNSQEMSAAGFCGADFGDSLQASCMACKEMAMSELRQQMLALWILLMLLLMVPWVLE